MINALEAKDENGNVHGYHLVSDNGWKGKDCSNCHQFHRYVPLSRVKGITEVPALLWFDCECQSTLTARAPRKNRSKT